MAGALSAAAGAGGSARITIDDLTVTQDAGQNPANAEYRLEGGGDIIANTDANPNVDVGDWIFPKTLVSGIYEVRATLNSGTTPVGTLNTWLSLSANRSWSLQQIDTGTKACSLTIEIRIGPNVLDTATINLVATVP
jgi:hypothetical protein